MDRRLAGTLSICVVLSAVLTILIVGERSRGVTVIENAYPAHIGRSREQGSYPFHLGLVSRQKFGVLEIDLYCLRLAGQNDSLTLEEADLDGISGRFPRLAAIREMCLANQGEPEVIDLELTLDGQAANLRLVDFTDAFLTFAPPLIRQFPEGARSGILTSPNFITAFAFLFDGSGNQVSYYEGARDFFVERELLLSDLYVRHNDDLSSFTSSRMAEQPGGKGILDAPRGGRLVYSDVRRDDGFEIGFSVNAAWLPGGMPVLQIVRALGDLDEVLVLGNFIE